MFCIFNPRSSFPQKQSGWFGLRDFHCSPEEIQTVNIKSFTADLLDLKRSEAQSPKAKLSKF